MSRSHACSRVRSIDSENPSVEQRSSRCKQKSAVVTDIIVYKEVLLQTENKHDKCNN